MYRLCKTRSFKFCSFCHCNIFWSIIRPRTRYFAFFFRIKCCSCAFWIKRRFVFVSIVQYFMICTRSWYICFFLLYPLLSWIIRSCRFRKRSFCFLLFRFHFALFFTLAVFLLFFFIGIPACNQWYFILYIKVNIKKRLTSPSSDILTCFSRGIKTNVYLFSFCHFIIWSFIHNYIASTSIIELLPWWWHPCRIWTLSNALI